MTLEVIILAAGEGKRMCSSLPKILHPLAGKPLLEHVLVAARQVGASRCHVVIGHGAEQVREAIDAPEVNWVIQEEQLGTGHAVLQALPHVGDGARVLVLFGDVPLVNPDSLARLIAEAGLEPALLTALVEDPSGYGRIQRSEEGRFMAVVEDRDADPDQLLIKEINTGILTAMIDDLRSWLPRVENDNAQGEYYLPDILPLALEGGREVVAIPTDREIEVLGVNDRLQLNLLEREHQRVTAEALMRDGVSVSDANRIDVRGELHCGEDVSIDVNTLFEGKVSLGRGCKVGANCVLIDCELGEDVEVLPFSHLEGANVASGCSIGPYARLRPETKLEAGAKIGNFVETKKALIGAGSKVNHLSYIGDCEMGAEVNIGAGTITCNYDGANKHLTRLGDGVFIGSNSTLVAPIEIKAGGFTGAGSTISKPVGENQLAISRTAQRNIDGWKRPQKK